MSKALDLLRRLASGDNRGDFFISNELLKEIEAILAQPEQKPLTPRQGLAEYKRGYARAELDLKREPLSEDEIVALWANKSPANEFECVRLVEKAHGIGGQNEN